MNSLGIHQVWREKDIVWLCSIHYFDNDHDANTNISLLDIDDTSDLDGSCTAEGTDDTITLQGAEANGTVSISL